jgi:membrane protease YdiL (CAAX protease family)
MLIRFQKHIQQLSAKGYTTGCVKLPDRIGLFLLFLICGLLIFVLGSPYYSIFPTNRNTAYNTFLCIMFAASSILLYRSENFRKYWQASYAFLIASFANLLLGTGLFRFVGSSSNTLEGIVLDKISQFLPIVLSILALTAVAREDMGSIYIRKGNLKRGIAIGLTIFVAFGVAGMMLGLRRGKSLSTLISWTPLLLVFCFANASMEELWFRGIFLKKLEPLIGSASSLILTTIVFAVSHAGATYVAGAEVLRLLSMVLVLGLGCGYLMQKTDGLWGAILVHAGGDLFYAFGIGFFAALE